MRKKIVSIALASTMLLAMAGCGNKAAETTAEVQEQVAEVTAQVDDTADEETSETSEEMAADTEETKEDATAEEEEAVPEEDAAEETGEKDEAETEDEQEAEAEVEEVADATEETEADTKEEAEVKVEETKPEVTIPDWFDASYYAANNSDVVAAVGSSAEALYNHYTAHGKAEGRAAYEGDPNAKSQVADVVSEGQSTGSGVSATGKWYDGLPWGEWVDLGTCYIFIGATREPDHPQWCPIQIRNAADTQWIEDILTQRGYDGGVTYSFRPEKELPEICVINGVTGYEDNGYGVMVPTTDIAPWGY